MSELETVALLMVAAIMSIIHYLSENVSSIMEKYHYQVLSFNGGLFLALLFLILLPEVVEYSESVSVYFLILMGFVIFHFTNKFLYQHVRNKKEMMRELKVLHEVGFFVDHFMLGFVLVTSTEFTPLGFLIVVPIFLHTLSSSATMQHIHEEARTGLNRFVLALSTFVGALVAVVLPIGEVAQAAILSLILGMLFYIGIRDFLPREEKGNPLVFVAGVGLMVVIWSIMEIS
ncbi:MAG: hypothetical protein KAW09_03480 [Thermoplasmata archaeon]|nr:hypothetical protein [Thermoplasmata archaeon]